ncbi:MAG: hypothetical protein KAY32_07780 [Candidatus Eisenbacteria sp.]|nr:hypothetical protein [Candidatus Eisenbacteria bacterium]
MAVLFGYLLTAPILEPGHNRAGDDAIHLAYAYELKHSLEAQQSVFGWSYVYGVGAPLFVLRPPLFYSLVVFLHMISGEHIPLALSSKLIYLFCMVAFPGAVFYFMRALRFRPLEAGAAALFSLLPISTFGHTLDAYFTLGLAKQVVPILLFPIAVAWGHRALAGERSPLLAAILGAIILLGHPYVAFCLVLVLGLDWLILLLGKGGRFGLRSLGRLAVLLVCIVMLSAFYLVPMELSPEIMRTGGYSATWRSGFEVICETAARTGELLINGGLLDTTAAGRFGGGDWGWHDNAGVARIPILSWLALAGLLLALFRLKHAGAALAACGFLASFLLFIGPDDVPLLTWIPLQGQFQYIHAVFLLEFFAIVLAGVALGTILRQVYVLARSRFPGTTGNRRPSTGNLLAAILVIVLALAAVFSPGRERWAYSSQVVDTRPADTRGSQFLPSGRVLAHSDRDFAACLDALRRSPPLTRLYGAPAGEADPTEVYYLNLAPALLNQTNVISGFFAVEVGGANHMLNEHFRKEAAGNSNLLSLYNVRHLLAHRSNREQFLPLGTRIMPLVEDGSWVLYRLLGSFHSFDYARTKPILVLASRVHWEEMCHEWLMSYSSLPSAAALPPLVLSDEQRVSRLELDPERFAAVFLVDYELAGERDARQARRLLEAFQGAGGVVVTMEPFVDLPAVVAGDQPWLIDPLVLQGVGHEVTIRETRNVRHDHRAHYTATAEHLYLFKTAYYHGWRPFVDGEEVPLLNVSPGFVGFFGPAGEHEIRIAYRGANGAGWGRGISGVTLLLMAAWWGRGLVGRLVRRRAPRGGSRPAGDSGRHP